MKEMWITTHEKLADAYMEAHPGCTDTEALDATMHDVHGAVETSLLDYADDLTDKYKERDQ